MGAVQLVARMLKYVSTSRCTAQGALDDDWFSSTEQEQMPRDELERLLLERSIQSRPSAAS